MKEYITFIRVGLTVLYGDKVFFLDLLWRPDMINEILYMEIRLLGAFSERYKLTRSAANRIFTKYNIWQYIEACYDVFHINGDEYNLDDICNVLKRKGAIL